MTSAHQYNEFLAAMSALPLEETDEAFMAMRNMKRQLKLYADSVMEKTTPDELARLVEFMESVALASPYHDINIPGAEIHHEQTPGQDLSFTAVRLLDRLALEFPLKSADVIQRLENIIEFSLDYDIRQLAVVILGLHVGRNQPLARAALERQSIGNDNAYIRTAAREAVEKKPSRPASARPSGP